MRYVFKSFVIFTVVTLIVSASAARSYAAHLSAMRLFEGMSTVFDETEMITWIYDKTSQTYSTDKLFIFLGCNGSPTNPNAKFWPMLHLGYESNKLKKAPIIPNVITVNIDGNVFHIDVNPKDVHKESTPNGVYVRVVTNAEPYMELVRAAARAKRILMRFSDGDDQHDCELNSSQMDAMRRVLAFYDISTGSYDNSDNIDEAAAQRVQELFNAVSGAWDTGTLYGGNWVEGDIVKFVDVTGRNMGIRTFYAPSQTVQTIDSYDDDTVMFYRYRTRNFSIRGLERGDSMEQAEQYFGGRRDHRTPDGKALIYITNSVGEARSAELIFENGILQELIVSDVWYWADSEKADDLFIYAPASYFTKEGISTVPIGMIFLSIASVIVGLTIIVTTIILSRKGR